MKVSRLIVIGLSFLGALALFIWGFNFLKGKDIFKTERVYYAVYPEVSGLEPAKPVSINGVRVGQVNQIYFDPSMSGDVIVEMIIYSDFPIPSNSVARIFSADIMGSKAIDLNIGDSPELAMSGDTLWSDVEASLMQEVNAQVQPIRRKAEDLLASIDSVVTYLKMVFNEDSRTRINSSVQNIERTFSNLQTTTSNIDSVVSEQKRNISSIMTNIDEFTGTLNMNSGELTAIMQNLEDVTDSLRRSDIPGTFVRVNQATARLDSILTKINNGEGSLGLLLHDDSLYIELNLAARELNRLLTDIRVNPKRYVKFSLF